MSDVFFRSEILPASGTLQLDQGSILYIFSISTGTIALTLNRMFSQGGARESFSQAPAGLLLKRVKAWDMAQIVGTPGATIQFFYGREYAQFDQTQFQAQIATISGNVQTVQAIDTNAPTNHADVNVPTVTLDTTIAANAARRSVMIGSLSTNAPATTNLRVQGGAGVAAVEGIELQPGTFVVLPVASAIAVYNGDANAQKYWWIEFT